MEFKRRASVMTMVSSFRRISSSASLTAHWRNDSRNVQVKKFDEKDEKTDGGWGWVVVGGAFFALMTEMGIVQTLGIFVDPLEQEFSSGAAVMGVIASSCFATLCAMCPVGSLLVKRFGCRNTAIVGGVIMSSGLVMSSFMTSVLQLFMCLDLLAGFGAALVHMSATIAIGQYFHKRYALANGLAYTGQGFGLFIFPNLLQELIEQFGWRGTLLIEGAIAFNIVAAACVFRPLKSRKSPSQSNLQLCDEAAKIDKNAESDCKLDLHQITEEEDSTTEKQSVVACTQNGTTKVTLAAQKHQEAETDQIKKRQRFRFKCTCNVILDTPSVLVIYFVFLMQAVGFVAVVVHIPSQAHENNIEGHKATWILSGLGIGSLLGRVVHGFFIDRKLVTAKMGMCLSHLICVAGTLINPLIGHYGSLVACAVMVGFSSGWFFPLMQVVLRQMVGLQRLPSAYGLGMLFEGVGCATGGYIAGYVKDATGSYNPAFYFISGCFALAMVVLLLEQIYTSRIKKKGQTLQRPYAMIDGNEDESHPQSQMLSRTRRRWRYWVLLGSFSILMVEMASLLTVGVYLVPLREEFDTSAGLTGWLASSAVALMGFSSLVSGMVVKKFGCRRTAIIGGLIITIGLIASAFASSIVHLFLTLSLITGVGAGLTHIPAAVIIEEYFTTSYTFANGIAHVGPGVGLVRGFLIEGAIAFHIVAAACLFRPLGHNRNCQNLTSHSQSPINIISESNYQNRLSDGSPKCSIDAGLAVIEDSEENKELGVETWKTRTRRASAQIAAHAATYVPTIPIVFVSVLMFLLSAGWLAVLTHGVATAIETGASDSEASLIISVMGASSIFSRITHGWCIDHGYISALGTELLMLVIATVITYICLLVDGFAMLMVFATCLGFASGVFFTLMPVIIRRIDTKARFPHNFGLVFAIGAVGDLCGGYFAGLIRDVTGSYYSAFYFSGGAFALASIITLILYAYQKRGRNTLLRRKSFSVFGAMDLWATDAPLP
ncbi:uncharacterized protein [Amphiura filiformis]|uniref:uncharacterized protein n=1 Tax=Amphiura filiformis TaxID=82378 RepID=UPI003B2147E2